MKMEVEMRHLTGNKPLLLLFRVPELPSGDYYLELAPQFSVSKAVVK